MKQNYRMLLNQSVLYLFMISKNVYIDNEVSYITLYIRLSREHRLLISGKWNTEIETVWAEVEDIRQEHAPNEVKKLPNCMRQYHVSEKVFNGLHDLAKNQTKDLLLITPLHHNFSQQNFDLC